MVLTRPVTKTKISTVDFGIPVYDILKNLSVPAWVDVTMSTGFEQFGGSYKRLQYLEVGRMVLFQGMIKTLNDLPTVATVCCSIPVSIAPPATVLTGCFAPPTNVGFGAIRTDIEAAGTIKIRSPQAANIVPAGQFIVFDTYWVRP